MSVPCPLGPTSACTYPGMSLEARGSPGCENGAVLGILVVRELFCVFSRSDLHSTRPSAPAFLRSVDIIHVAAFQVLTSVCIPFKSFSFQDEKSVFLYSASRRCGVRSVFCWSQPINNQCVWMGPCGYYDCKTPFSNNCQETLEK